MEELLEINLFFFDEKATVLSIMMGLELKALKVDASKRKAVPQTQLHLLTRVPKHQNQHKSYKHINILVLFK